MKTFKYNKMVRDKTPERIAVQHGSYSGKTLQGETKKCALRDKFFEEIDELFQAKTKAEHTSELADILELIHACAEEFAVEFGQVENKRILKKQERGGFSKGVYINEASFPMGAKFYDYCLQHADRYPEINNDIEYEENYSR